jgi:hypothetical protein
VKFQVAPVFGSIVKAGAANFGRAFRNRMIQIELNGQLRENANRKSRLTQFLLRSLPLYV